MTLPVRLRCLTTWPTSTPGGLKDTVGRDTTLDRNRATGAPGDDLAGDGVAGDRSRLDRATNSAAAVGADWQTSIYEGCGEATVSLRYHEPQGFREYVAPGEGRDPERSHREAARRARAALRRFCTAHGCSRLWTLTFATEPDDQAEAWREVERFRKRLERALGQRVPLAVALDFGEEGGRLHFHMALPRYVAKAVVERAWGLGFVDARNIKAKGDGKRTQCRKAAAYLASYVAADSDRRDAGRHRYSLTRGMEPPVRRLLFNERAAALGAAMREGFDLVWHSGLAADWLGPPVFVLMDPDGGG